MKRTKPVGDLEKFREKTDKKKLGAAAPMEATFSNSGSWVEGGRAGSV